MLDHNNLSTAKGIRLSHFYLMREIVRYGKLSKAADALSISQSAATKSLQSLETALGVKLFSRQGHALEITSSGETFLASARKILSEFRNATEMLSDIETGTSGTVIVGEMIGATPRLLPDTLLTFRKRYPNVSVKIRVGSVRRLSTELFLREIDFTIGRLSVFRELEGLKQTPLYSESTRIICRKGHPKANASSLSLRDLHKEDWILPPHDMPLRHELEKMFHSLEVPLPPNFYESISTLTNVAVVAKSDFLMVLPEQVYIACKEAFDLTAFPIDLGPQLGPVGYTFRSGGQFSPAAQGFIECLNQTSEEISIAHNYKRN